MKRICSLLLILLFLPALPFAAAESGTAAELTVEMRNANDKALEAEALRDGSDETGVDLKRGKQGDVILLLPEDSSCAAVCARLSVPAAKAELQRINEKKRWESLATLASPGFEFTLPVSGVSGKVRLHLSFSDNVTCKVLELRCFTAGELPAFIHSWQAPSRAVDVLLAAETLDAVDTALVASLLEKGRSVSVCALEAGDSLQAACDRLWDAGLRSAPSLWDHSTKKPNLTNILATWIRAGQPLLLAADESFADAVDKAVSGAADPSWNIEDAASHGIWAVPDTCLLADAAVRADSLAERNHDAIRAWCVSQFESAEHADPAEIPYPSSRLPDGYLPEGEEEFIFEDTEKGLWAYLSQTLQVEIIKYRMPEVPHTWFEASVIFKPESETFTQHTWVNATFEGQQIYPETLAQTSKLVFAVNGDYHPNRASQKWPVGNIIRRGKVLYNYDGKGSLKFPNLDTLAIRNNGSFSVYGSTEITADELLAQGDVQDSLSFGPYLVRNGEMRVYNGNSASVPEPRCAYGMVEPGHLFFVMVEGKMPKKGEQGFNLWLLAELMYARGCTEAMNVDGGSTAVMIFMGHKLNRTGKGNQLGSPRNQHELFGIGESDRVYTDLAEGKKKKK